MKEANEGGMSDGCTAQRTFRLLVAPFHYTTPAKDVTAGRGRRVLPIAQAQRAFAY